MEKPEFNQKINEIVASLNAVKGAIDEYGSKAFAAGEYEKVDVARNYTKSFVNMVEELQKLSEKIAEKIYGK